MIRTWFNLSEETRRQIFNQTGVREGLPARAIEKDWWVTLVLRVVFSLPCAEFLVFKGGTSLSKSWNLIERFSEDIDLAIDREYLGFEGELSKTQVNKLRKVSCNFICNDLLQMMQEKFDDLEVPEVELKIQDFVNSDTDPMVVELHTKLVTESLPYLLPQVLIEIGARSLKEPFENRKINSFVSKNFSDKDFADSFITIPTVLPKRTFLEKAFLLHEEFQKQVEQTRVDRLSRHLYDLEKLMDTEHCKEALNDFELYQSIVNHRQKFNTVRRLDYSNHQPAQINFIPPNDIIKKWEKDYLKMQENMIYGESLKFDALIERLEELKLRFRSINRKMI